MASVVINRAKSFLIRLLYYIRSERFKSMEKVRKSCAIEIKSNTLMSCLSLATMTLLVFASVVIITIIAVTPIIILGIG